MKKKILNTVLFVSSISIFGCVQNNRSNAEVSPTPVISSVEKSVTPSAEVKESVQASPIIPTPLSAPVSLNVLALGDSYTIGQSVPVSDRWTRKLANLFKKDNIYFSETIIAQTGWTTANLIDAIQRENLNKKYDFVYLLIGVNNQYQGLSTDNYRSEFKTLLNKSISFADNKVSHVFVISIPDWGVTPFAEGQNREEIGKEIDEFNNINKQESKTSGVNYIDITNVSKQALNDKSYVAEDGLHPSGKMYEEWAKLIYPKNFEVLKSN